MNITTTKRLAEKFMCAHLRDEERDNELRLRMGEEGKAAFAEAREKYGEDFAKAASEVFYRRLLRNIIKCSKGDFYRAAFGETETRGPLFASHPEIIKVKIICMRDDETGPARTHFASSSAPLRQ